MDWALISMEKICTQVMKEIIDTTIVNHDATNKRSGTEKPDIDMSCSVFTSRMKINMRKISDPILYEINQMMHAIQCRNHGVGVPTFHVRRS